MELRGLTPVTSPNLTWTPYGSEGLSLPSEYVFEVDDPDCPVLVEIHAAVIDGQPRCSELRCRPRPGGQPVTAEALRRVALGRYLRAAAAAYSQRIEIHPGGMEVGYMTSGRDADLLDRAARQTRRPMTDDLLRDVSRVYNEASAKPVGAVQRRFYVSRATASRWIQQARRQGLIPPVSTGGAKPRKGTKR